MGQIDLEVVDRIVDLAKLYNEIPATDETARVVVLDAIRALVYPVLLVTNR